MKKYILSILLGILTGNTLAQDDITLFFLKDGTFKGFYDEEIDSITYSHLDLDSIWHNDAVVQEIWTPDSVIRIPIEEIDSICHKIPEPVYKPGVICLDERYLPYIISVNGMSITFSSDLPENLRPHQGDVLVYEGTSEMFPVGFAGKVVTEGNSVVCEEAEIPDIYDKFVFFGNYIMQQISDEEVSSYALRRIKNRTTKEFGSPSRVMGHEDDIDWRSGGFKADDIGIGRIKRAYKIELKKIHTQIGAEISVTPVISVELYWDSYVYSPYLFYKRTVKVDYDNKYLVKYSRDTKPESDAQKSFRNNFWKGVEPSWFDTTYGYMDDPNDDEDTQSLYVIDKEVPLPDCPLLKVGVQLGLFCQPKLEGEVSIGFETSGKIEKTYIYSSRNGSTESETKTSNNEFVLEGSVKGSLWAGLVAGLHVSLGLGKGKRLEGVEEEAKFKIGPYIEGEIKADFAEAIANKSVYSLVKDSKVKTGWKLGLDCKFKAKLAGGLINFNWDQFSWSPKNLINEHNIYFFPEFEAPSYTTDGNSLRCSSIVSRQTFSNKIGFVLLKEDGSEQDRKYLDESYSFMNDDVKYSNDEHPFSMTLTFDNLDFANHRYTIVPCTRLFGFECLGMQMPDEQRTTVLCPNSHHPHLIDLGLPSGTKWLCRNLYADNPKDAGRYYQWGKSAMVHSYSNVTYRYPNIPTSNYQGSEYDAATANLGLPYVTPTISQFDELFDNCKSDIRYSTWGETIFGSAEGVYLKGRNGNNLYLPFSGYKSGTKVNDDSEDIGYFLTSDVFSGNGSKFGKVSFINEDGKGNTETQGYGYSVRPVSTESSGLTFEPQEIDFGEVLIASQNQGKVSKSTRVTNTGTAPVTVTVSPTVSPFTVSSETVGTFILQPKESKDIYVSFEPTDIAECKSELTIQYETSNSCTICKVPLWGKGIGNQEWGDVQTETFTVNGVSFKMIGVEGGSFMMGSPDNDKNTNDDEKPQHQVTLSNFSIGQTEVTQALWKAVMGDNPSYHKGNNYPVEQVSREMCKKFISKLNTLTGRTFRLPTEAEWEYAARGGKYSKGYKYAGSDNVDAVAWYDNNSNGETHSVAQKEANELGLYDMSGNVWELCQDYYDENYYSISPTINPCNTKKANAFTMRSGGPVNNSYFCRVAFRGDQVLLEDQKPVDSNWDIGLRLVLSDEDNNDVPAEAIDLGLPSGTKWASCNVGATKPEEYGGYYAWGETEEKDYYYWNNYMCEDDECGTKKDPIYTWNGNKLYADIAGSKFDVATSKWGPSWQMPSSAQMDELLNECIWTWCDGDKTKYNGTSVKGYIISSKVNNNKIFLPAAGNYYKDELIYGDEYCLYWSSSQFDGSAFEGEAYYTNSNSAFGMDYNSKQTYVDLRYYGQTVRPVFCTGSGTTTDSEAGEI